jgi:hypothetical protein
MTWFPHIASRGKLAKSSEESASRFPAVNEAISTQVDPNDLADILHDAWIAFDAFSTTVDGVTIGGHVNEHGSAFRFELCISEAYVVSTTDPHDMGGFTLSDCRLADRRLLIRGDGPPGSVEVAVNTESAYHLARETQRFMRTRLGRWKPISE